MWLIDAIFADYVLNYGKNIKNKRRIQKIFMRHGAMLDFLHDKDIIEVNLDSNFRDKLASSEITVHRAIYKKQMRNYSLKGVL